MPAVLANGRISDRSYRRYRLVRRLFRLVLSDVALFCMQSEEDARRIINLGARPERVLVTGNLKMEAPTGDPGTEQLWRRLLHLGQAPVVVAGSTHRGEEATVLDAFLAMRPAADGLRLVLAPRHPERLDEVEGLARGRGLAVIRRSRVSPGNGAPVILLDTMGELASLYAVADVIFVGGSLVPIGGHNVVEPALHGKAVVFGPHMTNFRDAAALLLRAGAAIQVGDGTELTAALERLLGDAPARQALGRAAWSAVRAHQGACVRTVAALERVLSLSARGGREHPAGLRRAGEADDEGARRLPARSTAARLARRPRGPAPFRPHARGVGVPWRPGRAGRGLWARVARSRPAAVCGGLPGEPDGRRHGQDAGGGDGGALAYRRRDAAWRS